MASAQPSRSSAAIELPVDRIVFRNRERPLDQGKVSNLRVSMRESGFFGSILVRPPKEGEAGVYQGVIGYHRFTAWRAEGNRTIPSQIRILSDDEALQIEIDENLIREDLTPLERAEAIAGRFAVWKRRFPDRVTETEGGGAPKRGRPGNSDKMSELIGGAPETMGFAADTAVLLGLNEKTVRRAFGVVSGVPADLRRQLHGTPVARNDGLLRQLAAMGDRAEQAAVATVLIGGQTKNLSDARAIAAGNAPSSAIQTPTDETLKAFRKLWNTASKTGRIAILHDLAGRSLPGGYSLTDELTASAEESA
jgi:ParB family chromosome partitioning protein